MSLEEARTGDDAEPAPFGEADLRLVVAEIYEEVQQQRRSGAYPPGLERELDAQFAQFAPPAWGDDDVALLLERAERASFVDADVPTTSARPGVTYAKRGLRKAMAWYINYVAQQTTALGGLLVRATDLLDKRVSRIEAALPAANPTLREELLTVDPEPVPQRWRDDVVTTLAAARPAGRVLHAECGRGALVGDLLGAGLDAYGVEPRRRLLTDALRDAIDVRAEDSLDHLNRLTPGSIGGLVLSGVVDRSLAPALIELLDRATEVLVPGGLLVVVSTSPAAWASGRRPVEADLAPGRPLHAETWQHLLSTRGYSDIALHDGGGDIYAVVGRRSHAVE